MAVTGEPSVQLLGYLRRDLQHGWHNRTCRIEEKLERPESCPEECQRIRRTRYQCDDVPRSLKKRCSVSSRRDSYDNEERCKKRKLLLAKIEARRRCEARGKEALPGWQEGDSPEDSFSCECDSGSRSCLCTYDFSCCNREIRTEIVCPDTCPQRQVKQEVCECKAPEFCR